MKNALVGLIVRMADLSVAQDAQAVVDLTRTYARDPMGGGCDLEDDIQKRLIEEMRAHPAVLSFVAFKGEEPVGIANCLMSFSTFRAKRLINIHDLAVVPGMRGQGVSRALVDGVETYARENGFVGITLEVLERNHHARDVYEAMGFTGSKPPEGEAKLFCHKEIV